MCVFTLSVASSSSSSSSGWLTMFTHRIGLPSASNFSLVLIYVIMELFYDQFADIRYV